MNILAATESLRDVDTHDLWQEHVAAHPDHGFIPAWQFSTPRHTQERVEQLHNAAAAAADAGDERQAAVALIFAERPPHALSNAIQAWRRA